MGSLLKRKPELDLESTAKGAAAGEQPAQPQLLPWGETYDANIFNSIAADNKAQILKDGVSRYQSIASGIEMSTVAAAYHKAMAPKFIPQANFDSVSMTKALMEADGQVYNTEELEYLQGSVSLEDLNYRAQEVQGERTRMEHFAANPVSGMFGALIGDAPFVVLPNMAFGLTSTAFAIRNAIRVSEIGTAAYSMDVYGQSPANLAIIGSVVGVDALLDLKRYNKALGGINLDSKVSGNLTKQVDAGNAPTFNEKKVLPTVDEVERPVVPKSKKQRKADAKKRSSAKPEATPEVPSYASTKLKQPRTVSEGRRATVQVQAGFVISRLLGGASKHLSDANRTILEAIEPVVRDIPVHFSTNPRLRAYHKHNALYTANSLDDKQLIMLAGKNGSVWKTTDDLVTTMGEREVKTAVHEFIHGATAKMISGAEKHLLPEGHPAYKAMDELTGIREGLKDSVPKELKYYFKDNHELLAGLGNSQELVEFLARHKMPKGKGVTTALREVAARVLAALGFKGTGSALEKALDAFETLLEGQAKEVGAKQFMSESMSEIAYAATGGTAAENNIKMLDSAKKKLKGAFALWDNIANVDEDLANLLVSNATKVGARVPSVIDFKRNLQLEMTAMQIPVERAILNNIFKHKRANWFHVYMHRPKFVEARNIVEERVAKYLDAAYEAEKHGSKMPTVPADVADVIEAYTKSGWAEAWHNALVKSGVTDAGAFPKSKYYLPRRYSGNKMREMYREGWSHKELKSGISQVVKEAYSGFGMPAEIADRVAESLMDSALGGGLNKTQWRTVQGLTDSELVFAMRNAGISDADITKFMGQSQMGKVKAASTGEKHLRGRANFNMNKEYLVNGKVFRMSDIMETNVTALMQNYTNRMSGRVGLKMAGVDNLSELAKTVEEVSLKAGDAKKFQNTIDDTMAFILGGFTGEAPPELMRAAGNFASATMLKNSGLYQSTDTSFLMREVGMARTLVAMRNTEWFKTYQLIGQSTDMSQRLYDVLRTATQTDTVMRWLPTYAEDNLDLTAASNLFNMSRNIGQSSRLANGMHYVHRAQVNITSGVVADELKTMLDPSMLHVLGKAEKSGLSISNLGGLKRAGFSEKEIEYARAVSHLEQFGLSLEDAKAMQQAYSKNPNKVLPFDLQMKMEVVGTRMMDYMVQHIRTGETSAFAQFSSIGKVVIGYQSFVLAATNKVLRRFTDNGDYAGLAALMAYQYPLLLMMTGAKFGLDGKTDEKTTRDWIVESVFGMSSLGGFSMLQDIFAGGDASHSIPAMAYTVNFMNLLADVAEGKEIDLQDISRITPFAQEAIITRALINNMD